MWRPWLKFLKGTLWLVVVGIRALIALQSFLAHGRLILPLIPRRRTKVGPARKTMAPARKRKQMYKLFLHRSTTIGDHLVSRTFCSSWSVVAARPCRATGRHCHTFLNPASGWYLPSPLITILFTRDVGIPQILLRSDSGIPATPFFSSFWAAIDGRALAPSTAPPRLLHSLVLYLSVHRS